MLSKLIVSSYSMLLEVALWTILVGSFIGGWVSNGFLTGLGSLLVAFIFCVVVFGAFLTLVDIRSSVRAIEAKRTAQ